jgi:hypothetical protein
MPGTTGIVFWPDSPHVIARPKALAAHTAFFPRNLRSDELTEDRSLAAPESADALVHHNFCNCH